ncbi:MAG TPA: hydroxylamine reductase [Spirochaetota bacterium]|nr:hydroxylamine reductase [Spirochaetota bacterium]
MFCFQCQETAGGKGCSVRGVCGKLPTTADLQDLLRGVVSSISYLCKKLDPENLYKDNYIDNYILNSIFVTVTNVNFDDNDIIKKIKIGVEIRDKLIKKLPSSTGLHSLVLLDLKDDNKIKDAASNINIILSIEDEDIRSLREMIVYGIKGIAAYTEHAYHLGYENYDIIKFIKNTLSYLHTEPLDKSRLLEIVTETGKYAVEAMALLDKANTSTYGNPEITKVNIGVGTRPGILVSGHDLKDFEMLLEQSKDSGIDVYTHGEMLPAHYYPYFKKYKHFVGNYGNSWWMQKDEFKSFNGPILFTTNCIVPPDPDASYKDRIFVTGPTGLDGAKYIYEDEKGNKDFTPIIEMAKNCQPPKQIESGYIVGGFAHNQVLSLADKIINEIKRGNIKKFVVMAGCDGRFKSREYYTEFAKKLPKDTVILTAGCAKYRYNKLELGDINGIPRVLDAGQCNDSYSLAVIALKLKEVLGLDDVNKLPIVYNIAWYEQKAVAVLLALLYLGVKNIVLGPSLPGFTSSNIINVLAENFGISSISSIENDMKRLGL